MPLERLQAMDDWNRNQHGKSGLWQRALESTVTLAQAQEHRRWHFLRQWLPEQRLADVRQFDLPGPALPAPGNAATGTLLSLPQSGCQLGQGTGPTLGTADPGGFKKDGAHLAMADIRDSIAELRHYRQFMGELGGRSGLAACRTLNASWLKTCHKPRA